MKAAIDQLLSEGGKVIELRGDYCIVEKSGQYFQIDQSGSIEVVQLLCD